MTGTQTTFDVGMIEARIRPLRDRLATHGLYKALRTEQQLRVFMETHVFAVWDFMSLLKGLQSRLTCVRSPWVPTALPESRRFLNEIVLGEESDVYEGRAISHFELYLEAMEQAGANTSAIRGLIAKLGSSSVAEALESAAIPAGAKAFVQATFGLIDTGKVHAMAAAFTFGREDLIPEMFSALVRDLNQQSSGRFGTFLWYLERHIEVDGEDHGPLSLRMVRDICGDDECKWEEAAEAAEASLKARLALWDFVLGEILATNGAASGR